MRWGRLGRLGWLGGGWRGFGASAVIGGGFLVILFFKEKELIRRIAAVK